MDIQTFRRLRPDYNGVPDDQIAAMLGGAQSAPVEEMGDMRRGFTQSMHELGGTAYGLAGMAGAMLPEEMGEGIKRWGLENARRKFDQSAALSKPGDTLEGEGDTSDYLQRGLGYVAGQALPALLTGGVGAFMAKRAAQVGIERAAMEAVASGASREEIAHMVGRMGGEAATRGAIAGAGVSSYGQSAGSIYPDMVAEGHDDPWRAAAFAAPVAALDLIPEARFAKNLLSPGVRAAQHGLARRVVTEGGKQAAVEAPTEGVQTVFERQAAYKDLTDQDAVSDYMNSMALGALGGGVLGGLGGIRSQNTEPAKFDGYGPDTRRALENGESVDMLQPLGLPAPAGPAGLLGYNPVFGPSSPERFNGGMVDFPDGSRGTYEDWERYQAEQAQRGIEDKVAAEYDAAMQPPVSAPTQVETTAPTSYISQSSVMNRLNGAFTRTRSAIDVTNAIVGAVQTGNLDALDTISEKMQASKTLKPEAIYKVEEVIADARAQIMRNAEPRGRAVSQDNTVQYDGQMQQVGLGAPVQRPAFELTAQEAPQQDTASIEYTEETPPASTPEGQMELTIDNDTRGDKRGAAYHRMNQLLTASKAAGGDVMKMVREHLGTLTPGAYDNVHIQELGRAKLAVLNKMRPTDSRRAAVTQAFDQLIGEARQEVQQRPQVGQPMTQRNVTPEQDVAVGTHVANAMVNSAKERFKNTRDKVAGLHQAITEALDGVRTVQGARFALDELRREWTQGKRVTNANIEAFNQVFKDGQAALDELANQDGGYGGRNAAEPAMTAQSEIDVTPLPAKSAKPAKEAKAAPEVAVEPVGKPLNAAPQQSAPSTTPKVEAPKQPAPAKPAPTVSEVASEVDPTNPEAAEFWVRKLLRGQRANNDDALDLAKAIGDYFKATGAKFDAVVQAIYDAAVDTQVAKGVRDVAKEFLARNVSESDVKAAEAAAEKRRANRDYDDNIQKLRKQREAAFDQQLKDNKAEDAEQKLTDMVTKPKRSVSDAVGETDIEDQDDVDYRLGNKNGVGMSVAEFQRILDAFVAKYKGAAKLNLVVVPDETSFNGNAKGVQGAYYAKSGRIVFVAANHGQAAEALETIQHEILGHFGLDLLRPADKQQILDTVKAAAAVNPQLAKIYNAEVAEAGGDTDKAAAETIANLAERKDNWVRALLDRLGSLWNKGLIKVGLRSSDFRTIGDLREQVRLAAYALRKMNAVQQTTPASDDVLFRQQSKLDRLAASSPVADKVLGWWHDLTNQSGASVLNGAKFFSQIEKQYKNLFEEGGKSYLTQHWDVMRQRGAFAEKRLHQAGLVSDTIRDYVGHDKQRKKQLFSLMIDSTTQEMFPDRAFNAKGNEHLTVANDAAKTAENKAAWSKLRAQYEALGEDGQKAYNDALKHSSDMWAERRELIEGLISRTYRKMLATNGMSEDQVKEAAKWRAADRKAKFTKNGTTKAYGDYLSTLSTKQRMLMREWHEAGDDIGNKLSQLKGPYFPLMRFGKYMVTYKSAVFKAKEAEIDKLWAAYHDLAAQDVPKGGEEAHNEALAAARKAVRKAESQLGEMKANDQHYVHERHESRYAAKKSAASMPGAEFSLAAADTHDTNGLSKSFLDKLGHAMTVKLDDKTSSEVKTLMNQMWLELLPEKSALKAQMRRMKVAGMHEDMHRAFAANSVRAAYHHAGLKYNDGLTDSLGKMREFKGVEAREVYNEVVRRYLAGMNMIQADTVGWIERGLTSTAFVYMLGTSPAFFITNASQSFMVSMPMLAARFGAKDANVALGKAIAQVGKALTGVKLTAKEIEPSQLTGDKDERAMLDKLLEYKLLDFTIGNEVRDIAEGEGVRVFNEGMRYMSVLPQRVEVMNRAATALAAYRLAQTKGMDKAGATKYAMQVVEDTHFNYSHENAPYWMKPGVIPGSRVLFQFRKYQLGVLHLLANQISAATKGDPKARAEARRALFGTATMAFMAGGILGLPAAGTAMFVAQVIGSAFGDDDEPFDAEAEFRGFLASAFGKDVGAAMAKGPAMLAGMDLGRMGMGNATALLPFVDFKPGTTAADTYTEALGQLLGPAIGGLGTRFARGVDFAMKGDMTRATENFMPKGFADAIKAWRYSDEGLQTGAGKTLLEPDAFGVGDILMQSVGFTPAMVSEHYEAQASVQSAKDYLNKRVASIKRDYVEASKAKDAQGMEEARAALTRYNDVRRANGEKVVPLSELYKAVQEDKKFTAGVDEQGVRVGKQNQALGERGSWAVVQ